MYKKQMILACSLIMITMIGMLFSSGSNGDVAAANNAIRFAVIGDFGGGKQSEQDVADMIDSKNVDFVATVGDNVYAGANDGSAWNAIDNKIGKFYQQYIYPYQGAYGTGSPDQTNRFFPLMGNHDYGDGGDLDIPLINCDANQGLNACDDTGGAWHNYFDLPGNERTYSVKRGAVEVVLFSDYYKDHDWAYNNDQNQALQKVKSALENSTATWKVVLLHFPPYASTMTGGEVNANGDFIRRYDFEAWGADAVIAGHAHFYERLEVDGLPYFVNGAGGKSFYNPPRQSPYSKKVVSNDYGAMIIDADDAQINFQYYTRDGALQDSFVLQNQNPVGNSQFEVGSVTKAQADKNRWYTVNLQNSYNNPVVVMGVPSFNGSEPLTMRVREIESNSFQYQFDEWDYLNGYHAAETASYMVMEAGTHMIDGRKWHAATVNNVTHAWKSVSLPDGFGTGATLLAQVVAGNTGESATTPRIRNFTGDSFQVRVQEEQANDDQHAAVKVGTITTWAGGQTMGNYKMKAGTDNAVNDGFSSGDVKFGRTFSNPLFFAQITSYAGADTAALRYQSLTSTGVQIKLEEEKSADNEVGHINETVKWLVLGQ